jgi:hypothetical protein
MRFDRGVLSRPKRRAGSLVVEGHAARVHRPGDPLRYAHGDEFRDLAELRRIVDALIGVPVTLGHPNGLIGEGAPARVVGRVDAAWLDGEHAAVRMTINDADVAARVEAGTKELSLGYLCGARADGYQTDTEIDHLAIVDKARCGAMCSLRTDARLDCSETCGCTQIDRSSANKEGVSMADEAAVIKVQLDEAHKLLAERNDSLDAATAKVSNLEEQVAKLKAEAAAGHAALETEAVKVHSERADAAEKTLADLNARREEDIRNAAETRIKAMSVMGSKFRVDGMSDDDIQSVVIKKLAPKEDLNGKTAAYKRARFDGLVDMYQASADSIARASETVAPRLDSQDSREARAKAWREQALNGGYKAGASGQKGA